MKNGIELLFIVLSLGIFVQSFHMVEHVAQVIQRFGLGQQQAFGLLGATLDIEPVHFVYNLAFLGLIAVTLFGATNTVIRRKMPLAFGLIVFALAFQSWHFVEHAVKLNMHVHGECVSCPGILGVFFNPILLHFVYNSIVFVPYAAAFYLINRQKLMILNTA